MTGPRLRTAQNSTDESKLQVPKESVLRLLDRGHLLVTGPVDKARWNYSPVLSWLQRARFRLVTQLLGANRYDDTLEIGYGSGIFLPELQRRSDRLYGVDIHRHASIVQQMLAEVGVQASLFVASAESIPIESRSMDLIVSVSTLEYVPDQRKAASEMHRILRPEGKLAVVYPMPHVFSDVGLKLLTRESAAQYGDGRRTLLPALCERFAVVQRNRFPAWMPLPLQVYEAALLAPRD